MNKGRKMLAAIRRVQSGIQAPSLTAVMWFFCVGVAPSFGASTSNYDTPRDATVSIIDTAPFVPLQVISVNVSVVSEDTVIGSPELSLPAIQNAVVDAVSHLGITHIDMPCTSERVWAAIQAAG